MMGYMGYLPRIRARAQKSDTYSHARLAYRWHSLQGHDWVQRLHDGTMARVTTINIKPLVKITIMSQIQCILVCIGLVISIAGFILWLLGHPPLWL